MLADGAASWRAQHLHSTRIQLTESERFEQPYWDYLQVLPPARVIGFSCAPPTHPPCTKG